MTKIRTLMLILLLIANAALFSNNASAQWIDPQMYQNTKVKDFDLRGNVRSVKHIYRAAGEATPNWVPQGAKIIPFALRKMDYHFNYEVNFNKNGVINGAISYWMDITRGGQGSFTQEFSTLVDINEEGQIVHIDAAPYKSTYSYTNGLLTEIFTTPPVREGTSYKYENGRKVEVYATPLKKGELAKRALWYTTFSYDNDGNLTEAITQSYSQSIKNGKISSGNIEDEYYYQYFHRDLNNGEKEVYRYEYPSQKSSKWETFSTWRYDAAGVLTSYNNLRYSYNAEGQICEIFDESAAATTIIKYNEQGDIISRQYKSKGFVYLQEYQYEYDKCGNWITCKCLKDSTLQYICEREIEYY